MYEKLKFFESTLLKQVPEYTLKDFLYFSIPYLHKKVVSQKLNE